MAKIVVGDDSGVDLFEIDFSQLNFASDYVRTSSRFEAIYGFGTAETFRGKDFRYSSDGVPNAGTVKSYSAMEDGLTSLKVSGFSIKATRFVSAASTEGQADDLALVRKILAKKDIFVGGQNADSVGTFGGKDELYGRGGDDELDGGKGNDKLYGGSGSDLLIGGSGRDRFYFQEMPFEFESDRISDFSSAKDTLIFSAALFGQNASASLNPDMLTFGAVATDDNDRFIYDQSTGILSYDADGNGLAAATAIVTLLNRAAIDASDIVLS